MIWKQIFKRCLAFTRYNNKTYRIDDIDWSVKPTDTFQKRDGTEITYVDYYKQVGLFPLHPHLPSSELREVSLFLFKSNSSPPTHIPNCQVEPPSSIILCLVPSPPSLPSLAWLRFSSCLLLSLFLSSEQSPLKACLIMSLPCLKYFRRSPLP